MLPVRLVGVELGSMPIPNERWRVGVANVEPLRLAKEILTLGWATTDTQALAKGWRENVASAGLGFPATEPVAQGDLFVVDMKFSALSAALLPLSAIVHRWEQTTPGAQVVYVARIPANEDSGAGVVARSSALNLIARDVLAAKTATDPVAKLQRAGKTALNTLQLGFWAIIIGGGAWLVFKSGIGRK